MKPKSGRFAVDQANGESPGRGWPDLFRNKWLPRISQCRLSNCGLGWAMGLILTSGLAHAATFVVTTAAGSGPGSLRQAILNANTNPGPNVINFNVPGSGVQHIPAGSMPTIMSAVTIDGTTQPGYAGCRSLTSRMAWSCRRAIPFCARCRSALPPACSEWR